MSGGDRKQWQTIKIEEPVRDEASEDPRTYTEIMRAGLEDGSDNGFGDELYALFEDVDADSVSDVAEVRGRGNSDGVDGLQDEIQKLKELVERVPENTADELEGRFR